MLTVEEEKSTLSDKGLQLVKNNAIIADPQEDEFSNWLLSQPHSAAKDKLFEHTLLLHPLHEKTIPYYQMATEKDCFEELLSLPLAHINQISTTTQWYSFESEGHFYVDFAHPTAFGGGFRSFGNVQEETLFIEFPTLAHLAFATQEKPIHCTNAEAQPTPFLVPDIKRHFVLNDLYGGALEKTALDLIGSKIEKLDLANQPCIHILGMAAKNWSGKSKKYSLDDLHYHLKAAFLAFSGAKMITPKDKSTLIHTGLWGCGVFRNSAKTMVLTQALAAQLAEVEIIFEGVDRGDQPHYTSSFINEVRTLLTSSKEVNQVLDLILANQLKDRSWAPT